jgi:hypothetical protein
MLPRTTYVAHIRTSIVNIARALSLSLSLARYENETRRLIIHLYSCSTIGSSASDYRPAEQDDDAWMRDQDRMIANMLSAASLGTGNNYM